MAVKTPIVNGDDIAAVQQMAPGTDALWLAGANANTGFWVEGVASYGTTVISTTGALVIKTNILSTANNMAVIRVRGYNYSGSPGPWELTVGGYFYSVGPNFLNNGYQLHGAPPFTSVQAAITPDGYKCLIIGADSTVWSYLRIVVDAMNSYSGATIASLDGWVASLVADTSAYTTKVAVTRRQFAPVSIGGVSFDGSANINLPGVNTTGNQNTTGSAATLTTARTLTIGATGKSFNGSANVSWSLAEIGAADDTAVVHLTGNEPISGVKTLTSTGCGVTNSAEAQWHLNSTGGRNIRLVSNTTPNTGVYDATNGRWLLRIGSDNETYIGNTPSLAWHAGNFDPSTKFDTAGGTISGSVTVSGVVQDSIGNLREIPPNVQNTNYTFTLFDRGRHVIKTDGTAHTYTVPPNSTTAFPSGSAVTVVNLAGTANNITVSPGSGVTIVRSGVSGGFTIAPGNMVTLLKVATDVWQA